MDKLDTSDHKLKKKSCDLLAQPNSLFGGSRHVQVDVSLMDRWKQPASESQMSGPRDAEDPELRGIEVY